MVRKETKLNEFAYMAAVTGGSLIIALIISAVAIRPLYASLKKTNAEVKEKKLVLEKLETNLETLKGLDSKKEELKEKNEKVLSALPEGKDVPRLFVQMERIAAAAGLQIGNVSETQLTDNSALPTGEIVPLYYQVSGNANSYRSLKTALKNIEEGLRLISVEEINIQGGNGETLTVNFTVKTYSRGQK